MYCTECGNQLEGTFKFCPKCGVKTVNSSGIQENNSQANNYQEILTLNEMSISANEKVVSDNLENDTSSSVSKWFTIICYIISMYSLFLPFIEINLYANSQKLNFWDIASQGKGIDIVGAIVVGVLLIGISVYISNMKIVSRIMGIIIVIAGLFVFLGFESEIQSSGSIGAMGSGCKIFLFSTVGICLGMFLTKYNETNNDINNQKIQ